MPTVVAWLVVWAALGPGALPAGGAERQGDCAVEIVRPEKGPRRDRFIQWLKAHHQEAGWTGEEYYFEGAEPHIEGFDLRIADVDNDGVPESTVSTHEGSGGFLYFWIFRPAGDGWVLVKNPVGDETMMHDYEDEFLVRFCGKTYFNFLGGRTPFYSRQTVVWEKGALRPVCDAAWMREQRRQFQTFFDRRLYDQAHGFLDGVLDDCAAAAEPETVLWMQSDLALTGYRMGQLQDCRQHVEAAQKSAAFSKAGAGVRRALEANAALCAPTAKPAPGASYDFGWLLAELKRHPDRQIVLDPRFGGLLSAVVPEKTFEDGQSLRDALTRSVFLPEPAEIVAGRYLLISGCEPHNCENKGFIWIDTVAKKAIVCTAGLLASKTIPAAGIPAEFWKQAPLAVLGEVIDYLGPGGETRRIEVP